MEDLHCHDCRVVKRIFQDHWIGGDCLELPINSGTKLQQPGDLKTKKQQICKVLHIYWMVGPPDNSKKKRSSKLKKSFAHFLGLLCPPDRVSKLKSYFAGDDDIRLGHDLHHVSHYYHQVIQDYVFYLIGIFLIGPFFNTNCTSYFHSIRSINH